MQTSYAYPNQRQKPVKPLIYKRKQLSKMKQMDAQNFASPFPIRRRTWLQHMAFGSGALASAALAPAATAQGLKGTGRSLAVVQIADMSPEQIDVSKDFLTGARAAWADINSKGGLRGQPVQHVVLETDGSTSALRRAVDTVRTMPHCMAAFGTVGHQSAEQTATLLQKELPDLAHIAPWLQSTDNDVPGTSFPIFAGRNEQIAHALQSLSNMGVDQIGIVFASATERTASLPELERLGRAMNVRTTLLPVPSDLQRLGQSLNTSSPPILLFIGGTPELMAMAQGMVKQTLQRYVIALADVNVQTLQQSGLPRHVAVIATQVVPLVNNAQIPLVRQYRETMNRLYDEPPSPQSLAGFVSARYTFEVLRQIEGPMHRAAVMAALQNRKSMDLGGFQISAATPRRSGSYVTQSMLASNGRFIG